jgi:iron complex transport system ATP-binding protein
MLSISKLYAGYNGYDVIKNISAEVGSNQNLCIMGSNGSGKTTLVKAVAGIIPSRGNISIDGKTAASMKRIELAGKVAVMTQIASVYFSYTVFETVLMGRYARMKASLLKRHSSYDREYAESCLEVTGLKELRNKPIIELSGGQLQRVHLARALAQEPQIIILDEPTNHLDLKHQVEIIDFLREWSRKEGNSVVGVLHDINLAVRLSDKVLLLKDGVQVGYGNTDEIIDKTILKNVYDMDVVDYMVKSYKKWERLDWRSSNERVV